MRIPVAVARLALAAAAVAAVAATWIGAQPANPFNVFGFFTIQGNLIGAAVLALGAIRLLRRRQPTLGWSVVRWSAATYLVVVGLVYWAVLAPLHAAGGVRMPWANLVLHTVLPAAALIDWLAVRDRLAVPARLLPAVLAYPLVWTAVVLVRGATDGWVPYPFLAPSQGYPVVAAWVALVGGVFAGVAAVLRLAARR